MTCNFTLIIILKSIEISERPSLYLQKLGERAAPIFFENEQFIGAACEEGQSWCIVNKHITKLEKESGWGRGSLTNCK